LDPLHPSRDRSPATFDLPITLRVNLLYNVPNLHTNPVVEVFTNGWRISPIYQGQSGSDFTITEGNSRSFSYQGGNGSGLDRPDVVAGRSKSSIINGTSTCATGAFAGVKLGTVSHYFDPCAFQIQPAGFYGNAGRDFLRGPGYNTVDLSFAKVTAARFLGDQGGVEFRAEFFNLLNHANFATPANVVYTPTAYGVGTAYNPAAHVETPVSTAGQITRTLSTSRQLQLALKVVF
jgi:hypothetical protein